MIEALYIHIPFCTSRCAYCDFDTSACHDDAMMDEYVDALSLQVRRASKAGLLGRVRTIYIGGGTPTHLGPRRLNSLVYMLSLSINLETVEEFTVEANPESLDPRMVKDLFALGVNRFSIGAQSFDDEVLRAYRRPHDVAAIYAAVDAVRERDASFSLDLICGGPGQTMESWRQSVASALALGARHVSIYPLSVEEGTLFGDWVASGKWEGPDEELEAAMMEEAEALMSEAGLSRYEVASYASPGCQSRHNTLYWSGGEYLGLGAGAASMLSADTWRGCWEAKLFEQADVAIPKDAVRVRVQASPDSVAFSRTYGKPQVELESMDKRESLLEDVMLAFRKSSGLDRRLAASACALVPQLPGVLAELQDKGLVEKTEEGSLAPTKRGWLMGNEIFGAIWDLA